MSDDRPGAEGHEHEHVDIGSVGEEAAKLLGALGDWAKEQGHHVADAAAAGAASTGDALRDVDRHLATGAAECRYCPICLVVGKMRATSPEVRQHLSAASTSLLAAVAGMLATPVPDDARRRGPVERIDLADDPGPDPDGRPAGSSGNDRHHGSDSDVGAVPWWADAPPTDDTGEGRRPRRTRRACTDEEETR